MNDCYARAVKYLKENPSKIRSAWGFDAPAPAAASCLFQFAGKTSETRDGQPIGCLTQIKGGYLVAQTKKLTAAIRSDKRIPDREDGITIHNLHVFAEWQRRLDKELKRTPQ